MKDSIDSISFLSSTRKSRIELKVASLLGGKEFDISRKSRIELKEYAFERDLSLLICKSRIELKGIPRRWKVAVRDSKSRIELKASHVGLIQEVAEK